MKKLFFPSRVTAKDLTEEPDLGEVRFVTTTYPHNIPDTGELRVIPDGCLFEKDRSDVVQ
jgi:hypothetical protein